jgi:hypothetical protein
MKSPSEVRDQLVSLIGNTIRISAGYQNDFDPNKVYKGWRANISADERDSQYPKTFVMLDHGEQVPGISGDDTEILGLVIVHVVKKTASNDGQTLVESALKDFLRFFSLNRTLGNFVQNASIVEFATDGGVLEPEGTLAIRVKTERSAFGNP